MPTIDAVGILAAGTVTRRAMEDRFAEIKNVLDFGATGNGFTDDRAAIQSAIDWTVATGFRGKIFFPPGNYLITAPLVYGVEADPSIIFSGVANASLIFGNFDGFLIDRSTTATPTLNTANPGTCVIERLRFQNPYPSTSAGCVRWNYGYGIAIRDCTFSGFNCISCDSTLGLTVSNCQLPGTGNFAIQPDSIGIFLGQDSFADISSCDILGFHHAIAVQSGCNIRGCRMEDNGNAVVIGYNNVPTESVYIAVGGEANDCGVWLWNASSCYIGAGMHGHSAAPYSGYGGGGDGTGPNTNNWSTYAYVINQGCTGNVFSTCVAIGEFNETATFIEDGADLNTFMQCVMYNAGDTPTLSADVWVIGGTTRSGLTFIGCKPQPDTVILFTELPPASATPPALSRSEGMEYGLSDGAIDGKVIGDTITAGSSTGHINVRFNGTNWIWCG